MNQTHAPFLHEDNSPLSAVVAGVTAIMAVFVFFLVFAGFAFVDLARSVVSPGAMQVVLAALGMGGLGGCWLAARKFTPERGRSQLIAGFAGCLFAALITLVVRVPALLVLTGILVGVSTAWTTVILSLCLRPTLHLTGSGVGVVWARGWRTRCATSRLFSRGL